MYRCFAHFFTSTVCLFAYLIYSYYGAQANARENGEFDFVAEAEAEAESKKDAAAAYFTTQSASKVSEESVDNEHHGGLPGQTPADGDASEAALGERIYGFGAKDRKTKVTLNCLVSEIDESIIIANQELIY